MMLKVLMYIFEHYMTHSPMQVHERPALGAELIESGFDPLEVDQALQWLAEFSDFKDHVKKNSQLALETVRVYNEDEKERMDVRCRGMIHFLEENGILNSNMREMVIDRLMALDTDVVDLADVKWVTLMVLFHHPEERSALNLMQDLVMHGDVVH